MRRLTLLAWGGLLACLCWGCETEPLGSFEPDPIVVLYNAELNGIPVLEYKFEQHSNPDSTNSILRSTYTRLEMRKIDENRFDTLGQELFLFSDAKIRSSNLVLNFESKLKISNVVSLLEDAQFTLQDHSVIGNIIRADDYPEPNPAQGSYKGYFEGLDDSDSLVLLNNCRGNIAVDGKMFFLLGGNQTTTHITGHFQSDSLFLGAANDEGRSEVSKLSVPVMDTFSRAANDTLNIAFQTESGNYPDGMAQIRFHLIRQN